MLHQIRGLALVSALAAMPAFAQTQPTQGATPGGTGQSAAPQAAAPSSAAAAPAPNPPVGGAPMDAARPIPANLAAAPNLTSLAAALKAAGLDAQLAGPGPFTVFAPTNDAFGRLAPGTMDQLLKPANKPSLTKLLSYHVVPGTITLADLRTRLAAGGGKTTLTTLAGDPLSVMLEGEAIALADSSGNKSYLEIPDVRGSNGLMHVVNGVVVPKLQ